jgi:hypothetical protein
MKIALIIFAIVFFLFGLLSFGTSKSAIHEMLAFLCFGFGSLMVAAIGIINAVTLAGDKIAARVSEIK